MADKKTKADLHGSDGLAEFTRLDDGREVSAQAVVEAGFAEFCKTATRESPSELATIWNGASDEFRAHWCGVGISALEAAALESATAIDVDNVLGLTASERLGADLIDAALTEVKALQRPWQAMTEDQQSDVLERITGQVKAAVKATIRLLATKGHAHITCELESITVKKGAKATLDIPKHMLDQGLLDAVGQHVILVVAGSLDEADDIPTPRADPDQADLLARAHLGNGDNGMADQADPED